MEKNEMKNAMVIESHDPDEFSDRLSKAIEEGFVPAGATTVIADSEGYIRMYSTTVIKMHPVIQTGISIAKENL